MFNNRHIVCAIEFGSSRIRVLVGESADSSRVDVIGLGETPSAGIVKGEIVNMELAFERLSEALDLADQSSGGNLSQCGFFLIPVTGCGIASKLGTGTVFIKNPDRRVTAEDQNEAHFNARVHPLDSEHGIINSSPAYFVIDDRVRLQNPLSQAAYKLDAHVHIVHGITNRLENFRTLVQDSGYESSIDIMFAPLAAGIGILSKEEHENGVMLVDLGAGVTEYVIEYNHGVRASGMIQIGFNHVINDLAIGLELPFESCRKLIEDGTLARLIEKRAEFVDFPSATGKVRRIPLGSFETIIEARLREIYDILDRKINDRGLISGLNSGAVLTGGGSLFPPSAAMLREVFDLSVRVGQPLDIGGASTGLENPRYSTVWGALKAANHYSYIYSDPANPLRRLMSGVDGVMNKMKRAVGGFRGSFKV